MPDEETTPDPLNAVAAEPSQLPAVIGMPTPNEWELLGRQVEAISRSNLLPNKLTGKVGDIMVIVLTGRELQLPPMMALSQIHVIEGKPSLSAQLMLALVLRAGHEIKVVEQTAEQATVSCRRRGDRGDAAHFSFSWDEAMRAGLPNSKLKKDRQEKRIPESGVWWEYPKAMLTARAVSMACRASFPDVLMGASYVPEELGADVDPLTGEVTGITTELIGEGEARDFYERIDALPQQLKEQLVDIMREQALVLGGRRPNGEVVPLLPRNRYDDLDRALAGLEQWLRPKERSDAELADRARYGGEGEAAEGVVVEAEPEPAEQPAIPDAELVENPLGLSEEQRAALAGAGSRGSEGAGSRGSEGAGSPPPAGAAAAAGGANEGGRTPDADLPPSERSGAQGPRPEPGGPERPVERPSPDDQPVAPRDPDAELRSFLQAAADELTNAEVRAELVARGWACPHDVEKLRPALVGFALAQALTERGA